MTRLNVPYRSSPLAACIWLMSIWYCAVSMATVTVRLKPLGGCQSSRLTLPVKSFMSPPSAMSSVVIGNSNVDSCETKLDHPLLPSIHALHIARYAGKRFRKQSRAEQSRAEQSRAEQSRAEQSRAEQSRAEQSRAEQSRAEQSRAEQFLSPWSWLQS